MDHKIMETTLKETPLVFLDFCSKPNLEKNIKDNEYTFWKSTKIYFKPRAYHGKKKSWKEHQGQWTHFENPRKYIMIYDKDSHWGWCFQMIIINKTVY